MSDLPGSNTPREIRPPARRGVSIVVNFAAALAAFSVTCALLRLVLPFPNIPLVGPKLQYFRSHVDSINVLFVGSSRFNHQVIPQEFDAALAAEGIKVRSFNLGADAMWPPESFFLLREVLSRPVKLKWVIMEILYFPPLIREETGTERTVYWHDSHSTSVVLRDLVSTKRRWNRFGMGALHVWFWIQRSSNFGRGMEWAKAELAKKPGKESLPNWSSTEGFVPGQQKGLSGVELEKFEKGMMELRKRREVHPVPEVFTEEVRDLVELVRRAGAEPVFVLSPTINPYEKMESAPGNPAILDLGDPYEYPQLFRPEIYYDHVHLNPEGAHLFTELLARKFIEKVGNGAAVPKDAPKRP